MVAERVEVFTKSSKAGSPGLRWVSDGAGTFEIEEVSGVDVGTTIVLHLKSECREYADDERIKSMSIDCNNSAFMQKKKNWMYKHLFQLSSRSTVTSWAIRFYWTTNKWMSCNHFGWWIQKLSHLNNMMNFIALLEIHTWNLDSLSTTKWVGQWPKIIWIFI